MRSSRMLLVSFLLVAASALSANAQSQDRDNPTPLTSGEIQGAGVTQKTVYYYAFEAGPGQVSATLEAKMKKGAKSASIGIELFDANANSLTSTLVQEGLGGGKEKLDQLIGDGLGRLNSGVGALTGGPTQRTSTIKLKAKQRLTLRLTVGPGIESYTVKLDGANEFGQTTAADPTQQSTPATETPAADATVPATEPQPPAAEQAEQPAPPAEQTPPAQAPAPKQKPAIVKIPGKSSQPVQRPAIIRIPPKTPPQ